MLNKGSGKMKQFIAGCFALLFSTFALAQTCTHAAPCAGPTPNPFPPQISTAGNSGRETISQGALVNGTYTQTTFRIGGTGNPLVTEDFSGAIQASFSGYYTSDAAATAAGGGWVITNMPWTLYGQEGRGVCSGRGCPPPTYLTYMPATDVNGAPLVSIVQAVPETTTDANGNTVPVMGQGFCGGSPCMLQQWVSTGQPALLGDGTVAQFNHATYACNTWVQCDEWVLNQSTGNVLQPGTYLVTFTGSGCGGFNCGILDNATFFSYIPIWGNGLQQHYVSPPSGGGGGGGDDAVRR
jgi:hypothetical protein